MFRLSAGHNILLVSYIVTEALHTDRQITTDTLDTIIVSIPL
jgi:hypothetical protein